MKFKKKSPRKENSKKKRCACNLTCRFAKSQYHRKENPWARLDLICALICRSAESQYQNVNVVAFDMHLDMRVRKVLIPTHGQGYIDINFDMHPNTKKWVGPEIDYPALPRTMDPISSCGTAQNDMHVVCTSYARRPERQYKMHIETPFLMSI